MTELLESIELHASAKGREGAVLEEVTTALAAELRQKTGLSNVSSATDSFTVTVILADNNKGVGSSTTYDDARTQAIKGKKYNPDNVTVAVARTAQVPYVERTVTARALNKDGMLTALESRVKELQGAYGGRVRPEPVRTQWEYIETTADYSQSDGIPSQLSDKKIVRKGTSAKSVDDAVEHTRPGKGSGIVKSQVYMATQVIRIYGHETGQVSLETRAATAPTSAPAVSNPAYRPSPAAQSPNARPKPAPAAPQKPASAPYKGPLRAAAGVVASAASHVVSAARGVVPARYGGRIYRAGSPAAAPPSEMGTTTPYI
jgi:hypothetical protein